MELRNEHHSATGTKILESTEIKKSVQKQSLGGVL